MLELIMKMFLLISIILLIYTIILVSYGVGYIDGKKYYENEFNIRYDETNGVCMGVK